VTPDRNAPTTVHSQRRPYRKQSAHVFLCYFVCTGAFCRLRRQSTSSLRTSTTPMMAFTSLFRLTTSSRSTRFRPSTNVTPTPRRGRRRNPPTNVDAGKPVAIAPPPTRKRQRCAECNAEVFRLGLHARYTHMLATGSEAYIDLLLRSKQSSSSATDSSTQKLDELLNRFQDHMRSIGGGDESFETSRMHRRNVQRVIVDVLEGEPYAPVRLRRLFDIDKQPDGWIARMLNSDAYTPGTVGVYINSLIHFINFLRVNVLLLSGFCRPTELDSYLTKFKNCQTAMNRRRAKHDIRRRIDQLDAYASPDVLGTFLTSSYATAVWEELQQLAAEDEPNVSIDVFT
jgi:hypothetical protein